MSPNRLIFAKSYIPIDLAYSLFGIPLQCRFRSVFLAVKIIKIQ